MMVLATGKSALRNPPTKENTMKAKTLLPSALAALAAATGTSLTAPAADLTVPYGTSTNITADATFDTVTIDGDLIVEESVTLTVTTEFAMGTGSDFSKRASLTLKNGATFTQQLFADGTFKCRIGKTSPADVTILTNALFETYSLFCGGIWEGSISGKTDPLVRFVLENGKLKTHRELQTRVGSSDASSLACLVELNGDQAEIDSRNIVLFSGSLRIKFGGGRLCFDETYNFGNSALIRNNPNSTGVSQSLSLESVDGADIRVYCKSGIEGNRKKDFGLMDITVDDSTASIATLGNGAFAMEGDAEIPVFPTNTTAYGSISLGHAGGFRVAAGAKMVSSAKTAAAIATVSNSDFYIAPSGTLDLAGVDLSVSGMRSLGTITNSAATSASVKLSRFDGAGLIGGRALWHRVESTYDTFTAPDGRTYSNIASFTHETRYVFTNDVELASTALDTTPHGFFAYGGDDYNYTCVVYDGWIWNRSGSTETWTFAGGIGTHTTLLFDDDEKYWFQTYTEGKKATFNVTPGSHHLQIRSYGKTTTEGTGGLSGANFAGWSWTENSVGAGVRLDRNGRDSTNIVDYVKIGDPGDGSLLTISSDGSGSLFRPAHSFSILDMTQVASIDLFGNRVEIGSLTGFGVVTNSNQYFDGTLGVTGNWTVAASDIVSGDGMRVFGAVEWNANATLAVNGAASLPYDTDYAILVAGVSMSGVPMVAEDPIGKATLKLSLSADGRTLILSRTRAATVISMR